MTVDDTVLVSPPGLRRATAADIDAMFTVRMAVRENRLMTRGLVTPELCLRMIEHNGRGWVCELASHGVVAFGIADATRRNIWALFVAPGFERRGIGRALLETMTTWLFSLSSDVIWLSTAPGTRAEQFYLRAGWRETGRVKGEIRFERLPAVS